mmetsp:Transcript_3439/g.8081  ORF Transcript_3439/g.8081 Transcript_3439/m.8081 type:complete len:201 (+) Transcript_3439:4840-5442(+)
MKLKYKRKPSMTLPRRTKKCPWIQAMARFDTSLIWAQMIATFSLVCASACLVASFSCAISLSALLRINAINSSLMSFSSSAFSPIFFFPFATTPSEFFCSFACTSFSRTGVTSTSLFTLYLFFSVVELAPNILPKNFEKNACRCSATTFVFAGGSSFFSFCSTNSRKSAMPWFLLFRQSAVGVVGAGGVGSTFAGCCCFS